MGGTIYHQLLHRRKQKTTRPFSVELYQEVIADIVLTAIVLLLLGFFITVLNLEFFNDPSAHSPAPTVDVR